MQLKVSLFNYGSVTQMNGINAYALTSGMSELYYVKISRRQSRIIRANYSCNSDRLYHHKFELSTLLGFA